ncbi:MAG: phosphodiester glycosidase family protein [Armatimonadetes bacterium]|nr:phosphodiester glycosidase family protein [Armatimonadota bacterium]
MPSVTRISGAIALVALLGCAQSTVKITGPVASMDATWPWVGVKEEAIHKGVTRWFNPRTRDNSTLELFRFDFKANPSLKFEMYDQDEDDAVPFDNKTDFFDRNVAEIAKHLSDQKRGIVIAAWNGLFHGYDRSVAIPPHGLATHIGPNVIRGKGRYNYGSIRWGFGVKGGAFVISHQPTVKQMEATMDFGAIGAQCLILDGKPLKLQDFPKPDDLPLKTPVPSTPMEAGHIPSVDFLKTSRTSMAWSKDNRYFYLLVVTEADNEVQSKLALRDRSDRPDGGWTLSDLQRFWVDFGADFAINSDGGIATQLVYRRTTGDYEFLPAFFVGKGRMTIGKDFSGAPKGGGSLMSFAILEGSTR